MCGIAGLFLKNRPVRKEDLEKMTANLVHRGPDNIGFHLSKCLGLAHARLSIIDLETGNQPLQSADKNISLIVNGEIYNYKELRQELKEKGHCFQTGSDVEPIIQGTREYGKHFVERINGMFAYALYDQQAGELLLARDRLGIKPLFYTVLPEGIAFASEIKGLLPLLSHTPEINPEGLSQFFCNQFTSGSRTIIEGIYKVLPGELMTIDRDLKISRGTYWSPADRVEPVDYSFEEAGTVFDAIFEQVMTEHIRSDVPYGLFLSGGVDSAIILAMLSRFQVRPVRTFSVGYKDASMQDELDPAKRMADLFSTRHTPLKLDSETLFKRIPYSVWAADDLMRDYANLPTSFLAEEAAEELKVVFTGEGGDEVFAGYRRYNKSAPERFFKNVLSPGSGGFRTRSQIPLSWLRKIFGLELRKAVNRYRKPFTEAWQASPPFWSNIRKSQYTDLTTALPDNLLVKVDRMLMGFSLEGRVPFLDHRIVEFGLSLPDNLKMKSGNGKVFLKKWAERYLPRDHLQQKKTGFHVPVGHWLRGKFMDQLEDKLLQNPGIDAWFQKQGVRDLFAGQRKDKSQTRAIWSLMQFAIWHNLFIEAWPQKPSPRENVLDWI